MWRWSCWSASASSGCRPACGWTGSSGGWEPPRWPPGWPFTPSLDATGGGVAAIAVYLTYPAADLLLLVLVMGALGLMGGWPDRVLWLLALGMMVFAAADTINLFRQASGTFQPGTPLDALWVVAQTLVGLAAWRPPRLDRAARLEGWAVLAIP